MNKLIEDARELENSIVEFINDSLFESILISICPKYWLLDVQTLLKDWL